MQCVEVCNCKNRKTLIDSMSCKDYLESLHLRVEKSKARGRFLVTSEPIPAGIFFQGGDDVLRNDHHDMQAA